MLFKDLLTIVTVTTLLQVAHCFEEIGMNAYLLYEKRFPRNPRGVYLRAATVLVTLNFVVLLLLLDEAPFAPYLYFYTVFISLGNSIIHIVGLIRAKSYIGTMGAGVFSGIPLGIAGGVLLYALITRYL
jgi:hypothetical protein